MASVWAGGAASGAALAAIEPDWEVMFVSELLGTKVLLATDSSEWAVELAKSTGSELHVNYVEPLSDFMKKNDAGIPGFDRELHEMIEEEAR